MSKVEETDHPVTQLRKAISKEFKMSQGSLASLVGCSRSSIQYIENGRLKLSEDMAHRIDSALGSSLLKWLRAGAKIEDFKLDEVKLLRNFRLINAHQAKYSVDPNNMEPSLPRFRREIFGEKGWDLPQMDSETHHSVVHPAFQSAAKQAVVHFRDEMVEGGVDKEYAEKIAIHFFEMMASTGFDGEESHLFHRLNRAALDKGNYMQLSWDFNEWCQKMSEKHKLGLEDLTRLHPEQDREALIYAVEELTEEERQKLGIRRIEQTGYFPPDHEYAGQQWTETIYEGLEAN